LSKRFFLFPCLLVLSALAFAACGSSGGDEGEVEEVIENSATSTDPVDCKTLETQQFMEQISRESGAAAVKACEEEAEDEEGADSVDVSAVEIDGESATAEAALSGGSLDGQAVEVELVKDDDGWKMNEVVKFTDFDHGKLIEVLEDGFAEQSREIEPGLGDCLVEAFDQGSQVQVEELLFGDSPRLLKEVLEACAARPPA
jgi:hypothetical protein